jgi:hypothetical protein
MEKYWGIAAICLLLSYFPTAGYERWINTRATGETAS